MKPKEVGYSRLQESPPLDHPFSEASPGECLQGKSQFPHRLIRAQLLRQIVSPSTVKFHKC